MTVTVTVATDIAVNDGLVPDEPVDRPVPYIVLLITLGLADFGRVEGGVVAPEVVVLRPIDKLADKLMIVARSLVVMDGVEPGKVVVMVVAVVMSALVETKRVLDVVTTVPTAVATVAKIPPICLAS